jgi:hypothetical protein
MSNHTIPANVTALLNLKGQIVTLTTSRQMKMKAGFPATTKVSTFQCRMGCNYDNIAAVKEGRADGTLPAENAGLNGVVWAIFPHLLIGEKSGRFQLRCTKLDGNPTVTKFYRDGAEISQKDALTGAYASEQPRDEVPNVFNVMVDNITHVNSIPV